MLKYWIGTQHKTFITRTSIMQEDDIYQIWKDFIIDKKYEKYFQDRNSKWVYKLNEIKNYIDIHEKRPTHHDKDKEIKILGAWLSRQLLHFVNRKQIMSDDEIYDIWINFINDEKYKLYFTDNVTEWKNILNDLKIYLDKNKKIPSKSDNDLEIKKISNWVDVQKSSYKKKIYIMKTNPEIYDMWSNFITDDNYKQYFEDNTKIWINNLNELNIYINTHKKIPSSYKKDVDNKLVTWTYNQQKKFKNRNGIMINDEIYNTWSEFIQEYSEYFNK